MQHLEPEKEVLEAAALAAKEICTTRCRWKTAFETAEALTGVAPEADFVEHEIRRWYALFAPERHATVLRVKRRAALIVMRAVPDLNLQLTGSVLSGAATEESVVELISLEKTPADEKDVQIALLNAGFEPEVPNEIYPSRFVRRILKRSDRPAEKLFSILVFVRDEPVLIHLPTLGTKLPQAAEPDKFQTVIESAGLAGSDEVRELLGI